MRNVRASGARGAHTSPRGSGADAASAVGKRTLVESLASGGGADAVQRRPGADSPGTSEAGKASGPGSVHHAAALGTSGPSGPLPHLGTIQRLFGRHDVSHIQAHTDAAACAGAAAMGADAFAMGDRVAFAGAPSLHTSAHEAAHVIQQRGGVQLAGGVGQKGDRYEQHADAVADLVVQGKSAEGLLDEMAPSAIQQTTPGGLVQRFQGDGIAITEQAEVHEKRSSTSEVVETLAAGDACIELVGRTSNWVKVTAVTKEATGWVQEDKTALQPGISDGHGKPGEHAPDKFAKLERAPFVGAPSSDDVKQGGMGDCWLLAPLGAIADTADGKDALRAMIQPNRAAPSYEVRLFVPTTEDGVDTEPQRVTVDNWFASTEDNLPLYAQALEDRGIWPLIVEKAVAQVKGGYENISGGFITTAYLLVTGKRPEGYSALGEESGMLDDTQGKGPGELLNILRDALAQDKPVSVHIPSKSHSLTAAFQVNNNLQFVMLPHTGVMKSRVTLTYPSAGGAVTLQGTNPGVNVIEDKDNDRTILGLEQDAAVATGEVTVHYDYTGLAHKGTSFDGGHVYQLHAISENGKTVELVDPHETSVVTKLPFGALGIKFNASFFVGSAKVD